MSASSVQVPTVSAVQALIDNNQLTTGAGTVQRQVVTLGDPSTATNQAAIDANGCLNITTQSITANETNPSITIASTTVLASNASAKYRFIQNTTATVAWLNLSGGAAVVGSGMYLGPFGTYEMSKGNGNLITGLIKGISTSGTLAFYCLEGT